MKPKAYSYIRFSSPEQSRGDSRRRQSEAAAKYAEDHNLNLVLDNDYQFFDAGISAYTGKNVTDEGKLRRFYDYVKSGRIERGSYLLVESLDRLSREDVLIALPRFIDLLNEGINVVTLADNIVYSKGAEVPQLIMSIVHMARAHLESKLKGERVSKAWRKKQDYARESNTPLGNVCPYWLEFVDGAYVVNEEKAETVKEIFKMTVDGYGQTAIVKHLNSRGVQVFGSVNRNKSGLWGNSSVAKILANRSTIGEYQPMIHERSKRIPNGVPIENYYPAIITQDVFYAAAFSRSQRRVSKVTNQSKNFNVWSKLIVCSKCRSPMHLVNKGQPPKGFKYLRCFASAKGRCDAKLIRLEIAEIAFREVLAMFNSLPLVKENEKNTRDRIMTLKGRIGILHKDLEQFQEMMMVAPSIALSNAAAAKEEEVRVCGLELERQNSELAKSEIFNRLDFFDKLDLTSYEGRSTANLYLRNLEVQVRAGVNALEHFFVAITNVKKPLAQFAIWIGENLQPKFTPLSEEMTVNVINQGVLSDSRMIKTLKRQLPALLEATEGNGRDAISVDIEKLSEIDWVSNDMVKAKLLKSLGLDTKK
ncbi:DNA invertase Pin-like site-specific DNA recombinase [Pseudomonas corrugata]|uniref:recombinase family protein n=1 Tax=Pseudomonas corrugata TaxID=47879 RepID=UPI002860C66D|nr:recombinase family protein [Pseudomonas corrugata]MDR7281493.1 DNA invertase Pin-like site-specific DNA recombinase [Pseudomonas corrugata]